MGRSTKVNSRRRGVTTALAALGLAAQDLAAFTLPAVGVRGRSLWASAVELGTVGDAVFKKGKVVNPDHDILLRVARGEDAHRTPVWLMRQVCSLRTPTARQVLRFDVQRCKRHLRPPLLLSVERGGVRQA
eukprot:19774-Eustigmatos_ZCMA.PRE.1